VLGLAVLGLAVLGAALAIGARASNDRPADADTSAEMILIFFPTDT
jgi:hypothetical protein